MAIYYLCSTYNYKQWLLKRNIYWNTKSLMKKYVFGTVIYNCPFLYYIRPKTNRKMYPEESRACRGSRVDPEDPADPA
jgi:hypothetical protein